MNKKIVAAVSHHDREVAELRADRELAVEYLKAGMESLDDPDNRAVYLRFGLWLKLMADWELSLPKLASAGNLFIVPYHQRAVRR